MTGIILILCATGLVALWLHQHITQSENEQSVAEDADRQIRAELAAIMNDRPHHIVRTADDLYREWKNT